MMGKQRAIELARMLIRMWALYLDPVALELKDLKRPQGCWLST
uniref:Uncharacterized protein n=1 Tax=Picea glauca TaxID=3330 RepID=A0A101LZ87_PICGL|nr:hypothetical protein ABT39_MTgene4933 [Picea glauca]QHR88630.1 hypothetical protein Q903MT_gene2644 [Picea sitchensis]